MADYIYLIIAFAVLLVGGVAGLVTSRVRGRGRTSAPEAPTAPATPPVVEDEVDAPADAAIEETTPGPALETPESTAGRLVRLRQRLSRSQSPLGRGLLALLSRDVIDEDTWEEIEDLLITADVGVTPTQELVARLRTRVKVEGVSSVSVHDILRQELVTLVDPSLDRKLAVQRHDGRPAVVLMVGVNGTGKTTTVGKLARVLVAEDKQVVLGAADTFRSASASPPCEGPRAATRPVWPSRRSAPASSRRPTWSWSTPPVASRTRPG